MKTYIVKRVLSAVPLLVCISFLCFVFINMIPSDPAEVALRVRQTPIISEEAIEQVREELGLNDPYLVRYGRWVMDCLRLDRPIFKRTASYGHFGRKEFPWERVDKAAALKDAVI